MIGILGIGNKLRGDDGVGIVVAQNMKDRDLPSDVKVYEVGSGGLKVLHRLEELDKVILVDSVRFGKSPGDYTFFSPDEAKSMKGFSGTHGTDVLEVIELSERIDKSPEEILILGIQPKSFSLGDDLSPVLQERLPDILDELEEKVNSL